MITMTTVTRAGHGRPVPGAFPCNCTRPAARTVGAKGASGTNGTAQPAHVYTDKARTDARMRDAMGSQPRRAPV
jgi:hypothetical protein